MLLSDHCGDRGDLGRGGGGSGVHPAVVGGMCESWLCHRAPVSHEGVTPGGDTERWCGAVTRSAATSRQARNSGGRGRRRGLICATQKRCARVSCRCKRHGEPPRRGEGPGRHADVAQLARASPCHGEGREFESRHPLAGQVEPGRKTRWGGRVARRRPAKPYTRVRFPSPPLKVSASRDRYS